jgi:outer membrane receptor protein involved in Fe transport
MKKYLLGATALRTLATCGLAFVATPSIAQNVSTPGAAEGADKTETPAKEAVSSTQGVIAETAESQAIVVTGSRIRRPNLESVIPITSVSGESFLQQGHTNIGDTLNELPQLRSTFSQQNPGLGIGIAGLNLLDLRGLGTIRTLVLVNGRRHVAADVINFASSPDVNTIPNDLVERVDVVTGGNSAVYGSDAIAGVVNFVMKRDFEGLQVRGNVGVSQGGFGGNEYASVMYGHNFADDRANVTVHAEYANQDRVFGSDVDFLRRVDGLLVVDVDTAGLPEGSDGFPDRQFFRDIRSASINRFGLVPITQGNAATCGKGIGATNGGPSTVGGLPYNCTFIFSKAGDLASQTGTRVGQGIIGGMVGGNGQTGREDNLLSVLPEMQRYNFNVIGHYSVSDALEPFVEAKYVRVNARGSNFGASFIQGTFGQFDIRERVRLDNPFLDAAERTTLTSAILASGCNTSLTAACVTPGGAAANRSTFSGQGVGGPLNQADIDMINAGTYRFVLSRQLADAGIRDEKFQRDTYRVVVGARGSFNEDWNYEISLNYGKMTEDTTTFGFIDKQRFMLSLDAGRNPANGQIQCRAQFDQTAAIAFPGNTANAQRLAEDVAACVPYNPFGGTDNSAATNYFTTNSRHTASMTQFDAMGYVSGDSSQLFELPGGPLKFVVGAEYRRETADYKQDPFVEGGFTNAVVIPTINPPASKVTEAFAEIQLPFVRDKPFFEELNLSAAGRVSSYGGSIGTVLTYNVNVEWSPIRDIRFRAGYGRAVRAPNVSETAFPQVPNFAPGFLDPCASGQIANNPNRATNCLAELGSVLLAGLPNVVQSLPIISGSNPDLEAEKSDSTTVGVVARPRFIPGLSLSADYYNIKVKDVIVSLSAQQIADNCYDAASLNNVFCDLFERHLGPGPDALGQQPGQIRGNSLISAGVNFAKRVRRGIDFEGVYTTKIGAVRLDTRLIYTHNLKISDFQNPAALDAENVILGELGDPKDEFRWDVSLTRGPVTLGYQMSYIGPMVVNLFEDFFASPPTNSDFADIRKFPSVTYHDIRVNLNLKDLGGIGSDYQLFAGIDNLTDKAPPLGSTATGVGSAIYNVRGRQFYAGFRARF